MKLPAPRLRNIVRALPWRWRRVPRFPAQVWIENTNCCNAHCVMCPREALTRKRAFMDFALFEKIMAEIARHRGEVKKVNLHNFGEPLLDKRLPDRIRLAKQAGVPRTYFVTNASLLTPEVSETLVAAGLDKFKISFYGTDEATYNGTMRGLDFRRTMENVIAFFAVRERMKARRPSVVIQYVPQASNSRNEQEFIRTFSKLIRRDYGDQINIFQLHNFGKGKAYHDVGAVPPSKVCDYPFKTMVILCDGRIVPCCMDFDGEQVQGDANRQSLEEVWNGPFRELRRRFARLRYDDLPVCRVCDFNREWGSEEAGAEPADADSGEAR